MNEPTMLKFQEDAVILKQGESEKAMYKVLSGNVALYLNYGEPDEYLVGILGEQRCFGELSVLCDQASLHTVVAVHDVLLLRITQENFEVFIQNNYKNAIDIMKNLANSFITVNFNLNMILEEVAKNKIDKKEFAKISKLTRQYTYFNADGNSSLGIKL